ncbi:S1/P1 nuclease [Namhaeicola litoreus]|uniref:S1/P1 nuclease n=1 Tax=Namhaeicola litoreus TaxID=1052145 RepID=A0ABW3Y1Y4_9FLAO
MQRSIFTFLVIFFILTTVVLGKNGDWGPTGHRTVGEIAQKHLNKKAEKKVRKLLNGKSLAYVSNYMDEIKSDRKYDQYKPWHYVNYPFDQNYAQSQKSKNGDIIVAIETSIAKLKNPKTSIDEQIMYLKFLIHLIGDLHQPLHIGLESDKGGNDFQVRWFNNGSNLHRVWDSDMIESFNMSYTELSTNILDGKIYDKTLVLGTAAEWADSTHLFTATLYKDIQIGDKLGYNYSYDHFHEVQMQLYLSGIRLANILNEIYG